MKRIFYVGLGIGFVSLGIGLLTFNSYSLIGMLLVGPLMVTLSVCSLVSMRVHGKGILLKNIGARWVSRGEYGYITAGVHSIIMGITGLSAMIFAIMRQG